MEVVILLSATAVAVQAQSGAAAGVGAGAAGAGGNKGRAPDDRLYYDLKDASALFEQFIITFKKTYDNEREKQEHLEVFKENLEFINKANKAAAEKGSSKVFGITKFTDISYKDFVAKYTSSSDVRKPERKERPYFDLKNAKELFEDFIGKYKIQYKDSQEKNKRFEIFKDNVNDINAVNKRYEKDEEGSVLGITQFADKTYEEFVKLHTGLGDVDTLDEPIDELPDDNMNTIPITEMTRFVPEDAPELFELFMKTFNKQYKNEDEKHEHFENFKKALNWINEENKKLEDDGQNAQYGVTALTDVSYRDLLKRISNSATESADRGRPAKKRRLKKTKITNSWTTKAAYKKTRTVRPKKLKKKGFPL